MPSPVTRQLRRSTRDQVCLEVEANFPFNFERMNLECVYVCAMVRVCYYSRKYSSAAKSDVQDPTVSPPLSADSDSNDAVEEKNTRATSKSQVIADNMNLSSVSFK